MKQPLGLTPFLFAVPLILTACSSGELKQRQEIRDRIVKSSFIYCEFIDGDARPDIDVAVNIAMGAKCDSNKDFSLTTYRTPAEINGVLFCCGVKEPKVDDLPARRESTRAAPRAENTGLGAPSPRSDAHLRPTAAVSTAPTDSEAKPGTASPAPAPVKAAKPAIQFEADPEAGE